MTASEHPGRQLGVVLGPLAMWLSAGQNLPFGRRHGMGWTSPEPVTLYWPINEPSTAPIAKTLLWEHVELEAVRSS